MKFLVMRCKWSILRSYIIGLINRLENGRGKKLILIVQYKSDEPVWKLSENNKDIVATNINDPTNGMIVGFVETYKFFLYFPGRFLIGFTLCSET